MHTKLFIFNKSFNIFLISIIFCSDCVYFKLPTNFIFSAPSIFKYFFDSLLEERHKSNLLNIEFAKFGKNNHL